MSFVITKRRKHIIIWLAILVSLAAVYSCFWLIMAKKIENGLSNWKEQQETMGWKFDHGKIKVSGFPWSWVLNIEKPHFKNTRASNKLRWLGSQLQLKLKPWDLQNVEFRTKGKQELYFFKGNSIRPIKARMESGWGTLTLNQFGKIGELKFSLNKCAIQTSDTKQVQLNQVRLTLSSNLPNKPETRARLVPLFHLNTEFSVLVLPKTAFPSPEKKISKLKLSADFLGVAEGKTLKDYLSTWSKKGGSIEIHYINFNWSKLKFSGNGTVALDSRLQPIAALSAKVSGYMATINSMVISGIIKPSLGMVLSFAASALANKRGGLNQEQIRISLTVQDGFLHLGPIKIMKIPNINWE